jgi:hypothetical protein
MDVCLPESTPVVLNSIAHILPVEAVRLYRNWLRAGPRWPDLTPTAILRATSNDARREAAMLRVSITYCAV